MVQCGPSSYLSLLRNVGQVKQPCLYAGIEIVKKGVQSTGKILGYSMMNFDITRIETSV